MYFVDKLLNIYIIYFVAVSQCPQRHLLTTVFRQNAAGGCVCVKGLQSGSPFAIRTRDPPIIWVEIPTHAVPQWLHGWLHCFSQKIDLDKAYHQIPIAKADVPKTVIATLFGLFEFLFITFGLKNTAQALKGFKDNLKIKYYIWKCFTFAV